MILFCPNCNKTVSDPWIKRCDIEASFCRVCKIGVLTKSNKNPKAIYSSLDYYDAWWKGRKKNEALVREMKSRTAEWLLKQMSPWINNRSKILEVGCAFGFFLEKAKKMGYDAQGLEISPAYKIAQDRGLNVQRGSLSQLASSNHDFDAIVMIDVIEHFEKPKEEMASCYELLHKKGGVLALVTPDVGSLSRKVMGAKWPHFKPEHLYYFSKSGLEKMLHAVGFATVKISDAHKVFNLRYLTQCSDRFKVLPATLNQIIGTLPFAHLLFSCPSGFLIIVKA